MMADADDDLADSLDEKNKCTLLMKGFIEFYRSFSKFTIPICD